MVITYKREKYLIACLPDALCDTRYKRYITGRVYNFNGFNVGLDKRGSLYTLTHIESGLIIPYRFRDFRTYKDFEEEIEKVEKFLKGLPDDFLKNCIEETKNYPVLSEVIK